MIQEFQSPVGFMEFIEATDHVILTVMIELRCRNLSMII